MEIKIYLIGGSSIRRFGITIKWMGIHNNIYPLYLPYGCSVSVRIKMNRYLQITSGVMLIIFIIMAPIFKMRKK